MFGPLFNSFCLDFNLTMSDEAMLTKKSFTYVSDAHNTCSWIDHFVPSCAAHISVTKIEVLHNFNTSDYHPLSITFNCKFFTQIAVEEPVPDYFNVKWSKVSQTNKANYNEATKHYLNNIFPSFQVIYDYITSYHRPLFAVTYFSCYQVMRLLINTLNLGTVQVLNRKKI